MGNSKLLLLSTLHKLAPKLTFKFNEVCHAYIYCIIYYYGAWKSVWGGGGGGEEAMHELSVYMHAPKCT